MADRLTELQDAINLQAENLCNAIGVIQQIAQPSFFADFNWASRSAKPEYQAFLQAQPPDGKVLFSHARVTTLRLHQSVGVCVCVQTSLYQSNWLQNVYEWFFGIL